MKEYKIGRYSEADIVLNANFCSRDHAKLSIANSGKILLQDYSSNGTTVNGKKINNQIVEINYGDNVLFAGVEQLNWNKIEKSETPTNTSYNPSPFTQFFKRNGAKVIVGLILLCVAIWFSKHNFSYKHTVETPLPASEIYTLYQNAVAMVEVKYIIHIHTKANDLYFGLDANDSIALHKDKSKLYPLTSEGTAFFIDSNGTLITNHHVVEPWAHDRALKDYFNTKIKPAIQQVLHDKGWGDDNPTYTGELEAIYIYPNGKTFSHENRIECFVRKIAPADEIDLASIQISSRQLPRNSTIIRQADIEPDEKQIQVSAPAYVIGFPYGDALAINEENELKCSSTSGSFTQDPSKSYIQYSAQTASGGSGSPVFNQYGKLVAITYLGSLSGQSFNRGILAKFLSQVL